MPNRKPNIDKKGVIHYVNLDVQIHGVNYKGSARQIADWIKQYLTEHDALFEIGASELVNVEVEVIEYAGQFSWPQQWEELMAAQDWHNDRKELEKLYNFCDAAGLTPEMPAFIMNPERWNDEYALMQDHPEWPEYDEDQMAELEGKILQ